jgi:hypothetical protein
MLAKQVNENIDLMQHVMTAWSMGEKLGKLYKGFTEALAKEAGAAAAASGKQLAKMYAKAGGQAAWGLVVDDYKNYAKVIGENIRDKMQGGKSAESAKGCQDQGKSVGGFQPGMMPGIMNAPGVTKVQYEYKGLANGPEVRMYDITGKVVNDGSGYKIYLKFDGQVQDGDPQLWLQYTVNYKTERKPFPCWSPFLEKGGTVALAAGDGEPSVHFKQEGTHRNGVKPWQEYIYKWDATRLSEDGGD